MGTSPLPLPVGFRQSTAHNRCQSSNPDPVTQQPCEEDITSLWASGSACIILGQLLREAHEEERSILAWPLAGDMTLETEHLASVVTRLHTGFATLVQLLEFSGLSYLPACMMGRNRRRPCQAESKSRKPAHSGDHYVSLPLLPSYPMLSPLQ